MDPCSSSPEERGERLQSGVPGLDAVLDGGFPARRVYLVLGDPGAGKTTLALQFLLEGVRRGERVMYVTLSETAGELAGIARSHGWSLDGVTITEVSSEALADEETTLYQPSEVELGERMRSLLAEIERVKPSRVVLDSCSEVRLLAQTPLRYRRQILALKQRVTGLGATLLLLDTTHPGTPEILLQSVVHGVVVLEQLAPLYGAERRRLRVQKLRGVKYCGGFHDFIIRRGGIEVFKRIIAGGQAHPPQAHGLEPVSSGLPGVDALLGGGPQRGTSLLLMGPAGCGKSTVGTQYALAAAGRGERVAVFAFDESAPVYLARAESLGMPIRRHVEAGRIALQQVDPAELSPGEFASQVRRAVEEGGARVVVIDSLNGYLHAMPEENFLVLQLHELLTYLGQRGVLSILTVAQHGLVATEATAPVDLSYLADSVLLFRFFESAGQVRKAVSAMKKRAGPHENTVRELTLGAGGPSVGQVLAKFDGVLGGSARLLEQGRADAAPESGA